MAKNLLSTTLSSLTVVDFSANVAGPYAALVLGELGARVIKIERPHVGDDGRSFAPRIGDTSAVFETLNRNKESVVLDLKDTDGRAHALDVMRNADVVVESSRPGVMDSLGLGFADVSRISPQLVYCSISAFGQEPLGRRLPGYDPLIQAFTGLMEMTGDPDGSPSRSGASISDVSSGIWAALGILAVLSHRERTSPVHLQISLVDSVLAVLGHQITAMQVTGHPPERLGSASPLSAPYEVLHTADGPVMVAAGNDRLFRRLVTELGAVGLASDQRFSTVERRVAHRAELVAELELRLTATGRDECIDRLARVGVPCSRVNTLDEAVRSELVEGRGVLGPPVPPHGLRMTALPLRIDGEPMTPYGAAPVLGADTASVLREFSSLPSLPSSEDTVAPKMLKEEGSGHGKDA